MFSCSQSDPSTAFLRAARAGQLEKVLEYLESGVDINASNAVSNILFFIIFKKFYHYLNVYKHLRRNFEHIQ